MSAPALTGIHQLLDSIRELPADQRPAAVIDIHSELRSIAENDIIEAGTRIRLLITAARILDALPARQPRPATSALEALAILEDALTRAGHNPGTSQHGPGDQPKPPPK